MAKHPDCTLSSPHPSHRFVRGMEPRECEGVTSAEWAASLAKSGNMAELASGKPEPTAAGQHDGGKWAHDAGMFYSRLQSVQAEMSQLIVQNMLEGRVITGNDLAFLVEGIARCLNGARVDWDTIIPNPITHGL